LNNEIVTSGAANQGIGAVACKKRDIRAITGNQGIVA
jgi:hypothetical protein